MHEEEEVLCIPDLVRIIEGLRRIEVGDPFAGRIHEVIEKLVEERRCAPSTVWELWYALSDSCGAFVQGGTASPRGDAGAEAKRMGRLLASRGWSLPSSLSALLALRQLMMSTVRGAAQASGHGPALIRIGMLQLSRAMSQFMVTFNQGHLESELAVRARSRVEQDVFVWRSLTGTAPRGDDFIRLDAYGLDSAAKYHAFRARAGKHERRWLEDVFALNPSGDRRLGMATALDGDVCGFVTRLPELAEAQLPIGVSNAVAFSELPNAFRKASRALDVARRTGRAGPQSLESLGLLTAVASDGDVAAVVTNCYLEPLRQRGEYGETLIETVRQYVECGCQLDSAASVLDLHNNTVRYRVAKFEEVLGVSLRDTAVLTELWWAFSLPRECPSEHEGVTP